MEKWRGLIVRRRGNNELDFVDSVGNGGMRARDGRRRKKKKEKGELRREMPTRVTVHGLIGSVRRYRPIYPHPEFPFALSLALSV